MAKIKVGFIRMKRQVESPVAEEKSKEMSKERVNYSQWLKRGPNVFIPTDNSTTQLLIDAGVYSIRFNDTIGFYLFKKDLNLDELIKLPMPESQKVMEGIKTFWDRKDKFKEYGYAYKRGIMLYGVPGGGKTSIINLLAKHLIEEMDGVIFTISSTHELELYASFMPEVYRTIEPERPIITVIEDIDGICGEGRSSETLLINVLDGIQQIENVVYIATTNYTERLSERIMNRPNRFDRRIEVKSPNEKCRRMYFEHKLKKEDLEAVDLTKWIKATKGMTMAHLGEVIKSVTILGNNFEETIAELKKLKDIPVSRNYNSGEDEDTGIGFKFARTLAESGISVVKETMQEFDAALREDLAGLAREAEEETQ